MSQSGKTPHEGQHVCRRATAEAVAEGMRERIPLPERGLGEDGVRRAYEVDEDDDRKVMRLPKHLRKLFATLDEADVEKIQKLLALEPKTIAWIAEKNTRELTQLDGAVDFITSSRTAARVLMWVCGVAVTFIGGVVALTKNGIDLFHIIRGGKG